MSYSGSWARRPDVAAQFSAMNLNYMKGYCVSSFGPDRGASGLEWVLIAGGASSIMGHPASIYDPSNGLYSLGDIGRFGGEVSSSTTLGG